MNISWVLSTSAQINPEIDVDRLKELGSFWGGWQTWRSCQTDNVICHDMVRAKELIDREFNLGCNFFIPNSFYVSLGRPAGVKVYEGNFAHDVDNQEDIISLHLASSNSDIVLLMGFDLSEQPKFEDKLAEHRAHNYRSLLRQVIVDNPQVQWVAIDHSKPFRTGLQNLPNLGQDTLNNILS